MADSEVTMKIEPGPHPMAGVAPPVDVFDPFAKPIPMEQAPIKEGEEPETKQAPAQVPNSPISAAELKELGIDPALTGSDLINAIVAAKAPSAATGEIAILRAELADMKNNITQSGANANAKGELKALMDAFEEATSFGDEDKAREVRTKIEAAQAKLSQPAPTSNSSWPANADQVATDWMKSTLWYGRDYVKTELALKVGKIMDPSKFATAAEYTKAIEDQVLVQNSTPAPAATPKPSRSSPGSSPKPTAGAMGAYVPFASMAALAKAEPAQAQALMEVVNSSALTEEAALKSINDVRANAHEEKRAAQ